MRILLLFSTDIAKKFYPSRHNIFSFAEDFEAKQLTLRTWLMVDKKTGKNVSDEINDVLQAFGLQGRQITAVTDASSNVVLACTLNEISQVPRP